MRKFKLRICIVFILIGCAYAAVFAVWWAKRPRTAQTVGSKTVWIVEVGSDRLLPGGEYLWYPAFWTVRHVFGYQAVGFAPEAERDVVFYARNPPAEWLKILHGQSE